jgi:hypothetical protein
MTWLCALVAALVGVVLFVRPHHLGTEVSAGKSLFADVSELFHGEMPPSPRALFMQFLIAWGCVSVLLPAGLLLVAKLVGFEGSRGVLILGGMVLVVGGVLAFFVEIISNMTFAFGGSGWRSPATVIAYVAPIWPVACGLAAIVAGVIRVRLP